MPCNAPSMGLIGAAAVQMLDMDDHPELWDPPADLIDKSKLAAFRTVRDAWLDGAEPPASTLIGIARLFDDRISIEIDAVAIPSS